jgi:hypothetical protein
MMEVKEISTCMGVSGRGGAYLRAWEFLFKGGAVIGSGSISQVKPEDKMATDLQNGDIIVLLPAILFRQVIWWSGPFLGSYHREGVIWFLFERILFCCSFIHM